KGSVDEEQLAAGINRIFPRPAGFGGPPGGGPGGGPGGPPPRVGPGNFLAGAVLRRADADKDRKVPPKELETAAEAPCKGADKDKDGKLDETEIGAAIGLLFPAPPGRGGPGGFGPPGGFGRGNREPAKPGPRVSPADVKSYPAASLYEPTVLRTVFLEFE